MMLSSGDGQPEEGGRRRGGDAEDFPSVIVTWNQPILLAALVR